MIDQVSWLVSRRGTSQVELSVKPVKILHIFGRMVRDGAEMRCLDMMRSIDRTRYQFDFCTLAGQPGDLDDEIRALGGVIYDERLDPMFPWRFRRLLRSQRFDVVHSHVHFFSGYLLRLAAHEGVPVRITHFHTCSDGHGSNIRRRLQRRVMRRLMDRHSTHLLAVSEAAMAASWGAGWQADPRCQVIYNGIDLTPFTPPPDQLGARAEFGLPAESRMYIHVGRMDAQKNHGRLIDIFARVARADPSAYLLLVGRGGNDIEHALRAHIASLGLADRVVFTGRREDVPRLLKAADLLIFPSLWEGLAGAVLEACAAGTPVLASDIPGMDEIAAQCPDIHRLALTEGDEEWARVAITLAAAGDDPLRRAVGARAFAASSMNLDRFRAMHCRVYDGHTELCYAL